MNSLLGYQCCLVLVLLAAHPLSVAEAHMAEQLVLDEAAQVSGRFASGPSLPPGQLAAAVVSPAAALLLGVAAALHHQLRKKKLQSVAKGSSAGAEGDNEAGLAAGNTWSSCKDVAAVPEEALGTKEGAGCRKLLGTLLPAVASAAATARQSVVACVLRIWGHSCLVGSVSDGSVLPTTGTAAGNTSSASVAGSQMSHLEVDVPKTNTMVNISDTYVVGYSCTTTAPSTSTYGSSTQWNSSTQLHNLSADALSTVLSTANNKRQSEAFPASHWYNSATATSSNSSHNRSAMTSAASDAHATTGKSQQLPGASTAGCPASADTAGSGCIVRSPHSGQTLHPIDGVSRTLSGSSLPPSGDDSVSSTTGLLRARAEAAVLRDLRLGSELGAGSFGKVYKGRWKGASVAVKVIKHHDRTAVKDTAGPGAEASGGGGLEALVATSMAHPNVVQTYHISTLEAHQHSAYNSGRWSQSGECAFRRSSMKHRTPGSPSPALPVWGEDWTTVDDDGDDSSIDGDEDQEKMQQEIWMIMEYCELGNLEQAIRRGHFITSDGHPDMWCISKALIDTAAGLGYLHSMGVVHGDLKPANVLLKSMSRGFKCKIADFGLSKVLGEDATHVSTRNHGTLDYMPPEVLQEGCLTTAADIYSFGVIMWELYTGTRVFGEETSLGQIYCMVALQGWRPEVPENMPADYAALMQACWDADRQQRPTTSKVLMALQKIYATLRKGAASALVQQAATRSVADPASRTSTASGSISQGAQKLTIGLRVGSTGMSEDENGNVACDIAARLEGKISADSAEALGNNDFQPGSVRHFAGRAVSSTVESEALERGSSCEPRLSPFSSCTLHPVYNQHMLSEPAFTRANSGSAQPAAQVLKELGLDLNSSTSPFINCWGQDTQANTGHAVLHTSGNGPNVDIPDHTVAAQQFLQALELVSRSNLVSGSIASSNSAGGAVAEHRSVQGGPTAPLKPCFSGELTGYWEPRRVLGASELRGSAAFESVGLHRWSTIQVSDTKLVSRDPGGDIVYARESTGYWGLERCWEPWGAPAFVSVRPHSEFHHTCV